MSDLKLLVRQVLAENRSFRRNPAAAVFTVAFPLMFMVIFDVLFNKGTTGSGLTGPRFYTPGIITLSIVSASFTNIAMGIVFAREAGILKRVRGTPLPSWIYLGGRIINAIFIGLLLVVIVAAFGVVFYHVPLPGRTLPMFALSVIVGSAILTALGLAATSIVPNEDAAAPVINFMVLPLLFISDVFIPLRGAPRWLITVGDIFPIKHISHALQATFLSRPESIRNDLIVMLVWGLAGVLIAVRRFRWEPSKS